jgi:hypothetical protein
MNRPYFPRRLLCGAALSLLFAGALLLSPPTHASAQMQAPAEDPARVITPESFYARLAFLASDALQGRDTPSVGLEVAAQWLMSEHRRMGLQPAGESGTFFQRWPYRQIRSDLGGARLQLSGPGGSMDLTPAAVALRGAHAGDFRGTLVFVHDLTAPPVPGSLEGRIVVAASTGAFGNPWLGQANRIQNFAAAGGALGSIVLLDDAFDAAGMDQARERFAAPVWRMGWDLPGVQIALRKSEAARLLPDLETYLNGNGRGAQGLVVLDGMLSGALPAEVLVDGRPPNVIAMIEGSDPVLRDEFVVLSAHFDHVGIGNPMDGDSIYNGADDNGSGTVALLEVAHAISQMPEAPRRSIAFVHVSGEEKGLLGASWFVDHATIPVDKMIANINADMIGGDAHRDSLVVIGKTYSTLGPLVDAINDGMPELRLITSDDIWPDQRFFFRSDQYHFMRKEIPSLFFFTGVHECYHRPCDTAEFVDTDKASRVARLLTHVTLDIANRDERPEWDPAGLAEVRALISGGR